MLYLLSVLIFFSTAFAGLDKIQIKNLDLNYVYPSGTGMVEKVSVGVRFKNQAYPLELHRRDNSFDVVSPFVDFQWVDPIAFFHNMQSASTEKLSLNIDREEHYLRGELLKIKGEKTGDFVFSRYDLKCFGPSVALDPVERLKTDCMEKMEASISHMELPFEFLTEIAAQLPDIETETDGDIPAHDFFLSMSKGDFFSYLRIKYGVRAYLKIWGHSQFEDSGKIFAIRVDSIKFGILPVTTLVMNELRRQVQHPKIKIDPPWIRIQIGE
jgi:hypothetical protein